MFLTMINDRLLRCEGVVGFMKGTIEYKSVRNLKRFLLLLICMMYMFILLGCNVEEEKDSWTITQYGPADGSQSSFYTIKDKDGNLIIVDGGWGYQAQQVREIIAAYDNHVTAWIISHAHPDHAGAFNVIMNNPGDIVVDNIYTIDVNLERYKATAQDYDGIAVHEEFLRVTENLENVHYVYENDEIDILGLKMKVLSTWNENVEALDVNLLNNGSMMFVLEGNEESMLFCSDVENEAEGFIIEGHKDDLAEVDYIQLGHHGNWGPTTAFYDCTNPKAVFFDAPNWLMEATDPYDGALMKQYFEGRGVQMYSFEGAPHQIVIY